MILIACERRDITIGDPHLGQKRRETEAPKKVAVSINSKKPEDFWLNSAIWRLRLGKRIDLILQWNSMYRVLCSVGVQIRRIWY